MKSITHIFFILLVFISACNVSAQDGTIRNSADKLHKNIGVAVSNKFFTFPDNHEYKTILKSEFNILVAENAMKPSSIESVRGEFNFSKPDSLIAFAIANNMKVRGHCLVISRPISNWMDNEQMTREELFAILKEYITTVVSHYKGKIYAWDVVNEAINIKETDGYRKTIWYNVLGPQYIDSAFVWAHQADPNALLFYNDNSGETLGGKSDAIFNLVKGLKDRNIPIDGVGLQCHFKLGQTNFEEMKKNMDRIAAIGLQTQITELDISIPQSMFNEDSYKKQAEEYKQIVSLFLNDKNCTCLLFWGLTDGFSWIPKKSKNTRGKGLILSEDYSKKPAYYSILNLLQESNTK